MRYIYRVRLKRLDDEPIPRMASVTIRLGDHILARSQFFTSGMFVKDPRYCFEWDFGPHPVAVPLDVEFSVTVDDPYLRSRFEGVFDERIR